MSKLTYKILLLVIMMSALVFSPLRGAFSLPLTTATSNATHCAQMQHTMHSTDQLAGVQDSITHDLHELYHAEQADGQSCNGDCCDGGCNVCPHGSIAFPGTIAGTSIILDHIPHLVVSTGISERTVHPLFRPPIFLY